jgi:hypothetical protein
MSRTFRTLPKREFPLSPPETLAQIWKYWFESSNLRDGRQREKRAIRGPFSLVLSI